jgi:cell division protein FtsI (penicillin-binding protein 3)
MTLNEKKELIFDVLKIDKKEANKINEITRNSFFIDRSPERNKILETLYIGNPYIKLESFPKREYPYYKYTKHLIGKTDIIENKGLSLIEKHSNKYKNNIYLSIDIDLQKKALDELKQELINYDANYGFFLFVDLKKEEILINAYDYNTKNLKKDFDDSLMPIIHLSYEFGSVFKPFTVYSALSYKLLDLEEKFNVHNPLKFYSGNKIVKDLIKNEEPLLTKDILKKSSNVGAVLINRKLDCKNQFKNTIEELGLLDTASITNEIKTVNIDSPKFSKKGNNCDTMSYGYSLSVTPIHLINAYARMITGNKQFKAKIIKDKKYKKLNLNQNSSEINKLLFYANESEHKLYKKCLIAGKTGTANDTSVKKQSKNNNNVSYISYFPYHKPRYLALTFMNNPRNSDGAYLTAGNTVKNSYYSILEKILFSLEVSSCGENVNTI